MVDNLNKTKQWKFRLCNKNTFIDFKFYKIPKTIAQFYELYYFLIDFELEDILDNEKNIVFTFYWIIIV